MDRRPIADQLLAYAKGGAYSLSPEQEQLLRQRYLHHSANWNMEGGDVSHADIWYINRPTDDGQRQVFPNENAAEHT